MTVERFEEIMLSPIDWKHQPKGNPVKIGLAIIGNYTANLIQGADHDIIYSESLQVLCDKGITEEEVVLLQKLGWHIHEDGEYLAKWV